MKSKVQDKEKAIILRKRGLSYKQILKEVFVAKSTLSNWLKDLPLTNAEKRYLAKSRSKNISNGRIRAATTLRQRRLAREKTLYVQSKIEFNKFVSDPFFQLGIALYWAEGTKRDNYFSFANSDPEMINMMVDWIETFLGIPRAGMWARLFIHKPYISEGCESFWSDNVGLPLSCFKKTIIKPTGLLIKKRPNYKGCLRIILPQSKKHLNQMIFWQKMLVEYYDKAR